MADYYRILKLEPSADEAEVKKAFNREMRVWSNRTNAPQMERRQEAERMVKLLQEAEGVLLNPAKRAEYDRSQSGSQGRSTGGSAAASDRSRQREEAAPPPDRDEDASSLIQQGWHLLIDDRIEEALEVATRATELEPTNADAWALLGQAKFRSGDIDDAIYEYKRAIKLRSSEASYYGDLGSIYESIERWDEAVQQYERAAQMDPKTTMYRAAIGIVQVKMGNLEKAIGILERCVAEEPDNQSYQQALGYAYVDGMLSGWWKQDDQYCCISEEQALRARAMLEKARALRFDDAELKGQLEEREKFIESMFARQFKGSWAMVILLGLCYVVPGVLWWWVNRRPVYKINRDVHDMVEHNKVDAVMGGELGAYLSALPPGFKWMAYKCPRYAVWIAILLLSPVTLLYLVYDNYGPKYFAGFAGVAALLAAIFWATSGSGNTSQNRVPGRQEVRTIPNSASNSRPSPNAGQATGPAQVGISLSPVANTTLAYYSHTSDVSIYFGENDGTSGKCITYVKTFEARGGGSETRTESYSIKSLGDSKWQIAINSPNPDYNRSIILWIDNLNINAADNQCVIEAKGNIYYGGQELWHNGERSMAFKFRRGNHLSASNAPPSSERQQPASVTPEQIRHRRVRDLIGKMTAWLDDHEGETTDEALPLWKAMVAEIRQLPAPANADSSAYSALLVGEWNTRNRGYTYRRDGTWTSSRGRGDPDPPVHGSWRIEGNVFIKDGTRYTIICLDESAFVYMDEEGVSFMKHDWSAAPATSATTAPQLTSQIGQLGSPLVTRKANELVPTARGFSNASIPGVINDYAPAGMTEEEYRQALTDAGTYHASLTSLPNARSQCQKVKDALRTLGIVLTVEELPDRPPAYLADAPRVIYYGANTRAKAKELADVLSQATGLRFTTVQGATPPPCASHRFAIHCIVQGGKAPAAPMEVVKFTPPVPQPSPVQVPDAGGATTLRNATMKRPFINSLGMKYVPVPVEAGELARKVLFSIWETRVQDYEIFVKATARAWEKPPFVQGPTHPAVRVSWNDATAFCEWLTKREHGSGTLPADASYRLPTDLEWSRAVGLEEEYGDTPALRDSVAPGYPWGDAWPPPRGAGNYDVSLHTDTFAYTSPVGSFQPNRHGLFDLGGNACEWVADYFDQSQTNRTVRGASWADGADAVMSSTRYDSKPDVHFKSYGFRCVLAPIGTKAKAETDEQISPTRKVSELADPSSEPQKSIGTSLPLSETPKASLNRIARVSASSVLNPQSTKAEGIISYEPRNVIDGKINTAWAPRGKTSPLGEWLQIEFNSPVRLSALRIFGAYGKNRDIFQKNRRIKTLHMTTDSGKSLKLEFRDVMDFNRFDFQPPEIVQSIRLEIMDVYAGSKYQDTPIAEITFE